MKRPYQDIFRNFYKQCLKFAGGVTVFTFIFLLTLELILRSFAFFKYTQPTIQAEKYAILTLGESTTATNNEDKDWPQQLESMLNSGNIPSVVYNEGKYSITTNAILSKAPAFIEKYKPQIIVTMMGIDDSNLIWPKHFVLTDTVNNSLSFFKSYKFIKFLVTTARIKTAHQEDNTRPPFSIPDNKAIIGLFKELTEARRDSEEYAQHLTALDLFLKTKPPEAKVEAYKFLAEQLPASPFNKNSDLSKKLEFFMQALRAGPGPADDTAAQALHLAITLNQRNLCKEIIAFAKRDRAPMNDTFLLRSASCLENEPEYVKELFEYAGDYYEFRGSENKSLVKTNYLQLAKLIQDTGICWIAMAYPRTPASEAMLAVSELGNKNIFLLLNQQNFEEALSRHTFEELFTDNFAVEFGHATELGNRVIATNVYAFIKELKERHYCRL